MNYKESTLIGTAWQRCRTVTIQNPYPSSVVTPVPVGPKAYFQEEQVVALPEGKVILSDVGHCALEFSAGAEFALLNPETGEPLGQMMTHQDLYAALYSLYMQTAAERDAGVAMP